ncbi:MAG: hypothetical protein F9K47_11590 [Burkholderiales bacterium]|nr:MAG: hypothetical protein F9K47_11590 [Burkholderiales bacterium]
MNHGEGTQAVSREYDANGHTRRIAESGGAEKRLSYDVAERLTQVESETGTPIGSYAYDPFGRRLKKTTAAETIYFLHGEEGLLAEYDATGNPMATYGWEPQGMWGTSPVWKKEGSNTYFYANDHLGTPQLLTDASGQIVWKGRAEAFGKTTVDAASTVTNNLRFPGQYFDAETGMHYNYFRDYESTIGRYVQSDPFGTESEHNTYDYAGARPVLDIDESGENYTTGIPVAIGAVALFCARNPRLCQAIWYCIRDPEKCKERFCKANCKGYQVVCKSPFPRGCLGGEGCYLSMLKCGQNAGCCLMRAGCNMCRYGGLGHPGKDGSRSPTDEATQNDCAAARKCCAQAEAKCNGCFQ